MFLNLPQQSISVKNRSHLRAEVTNMKRILRFYAPFSLVTILFELHISVMVPSWSFQTPSVELSFPPLSSTIFLTPRLSLHATMLSKNSLIITISNISYLFYFRGMVPIYLLWVSRTELIFFHREKTNVSWPFFGAIRAKFCRLL